MKMVQHPNVVRLYEVIDTATKLYLILELGDGGDMYDCIMKHDGGLSEEVSGQAILVAVLGGMDENHSNSLWNKICMRYTCLTYSYFA